MLSLSQRALEITPSPTLTIDARAKELKNAGEDVIGFGAGEPDFDTPLHIRKAAQRAIDEGFTRYTPASGIPELKEAICEKLKKDNGLEFEPSQIVVSNGAKHSLDNVFATILNEGDEVVIPAPYWVSYPELVKLNGGTPVILETRRENNFKAGGDELERIITPRTKAFLLNSPGNPIGHVYTKKELENIALLALKHQFYIVSDEIYEKLIYGKSTHISVASLEKELQENTIIVNGVSKSYAMTGWRIGYTASARPIASAMAGIQSHRASNPNSIAQRAALEAISGPQECVEEMRQVFAKRRDYMLDRLDSFPLITPVKPEGAFYIFVDVGETFTKNFRGTAIGDSDNFAATLLEHYRVAIVPGRGFGAPGYARFSYATSFENITRGLDRLEAFLSELA
jgi:aspartate aminotransferase